VPNIKNFYRLFPLKITTILIALFNVASSLTYKAKNSSASLTITLNAAPSVKACPELMNALDIINTTTTSCLSTLFNSTSGSSISTLTCSFQSSCIASSIAAPVKETTFSIINCINQAFSSLLPNCNLHIPPVLDNNTYETSTNHVSSALIPLAVSIAFLCLLMKICCNAGPKISNCCSCPSSCKCNDRNPCSTQETSSSAPIEMQPTNIITESTKETESRFSVPEEESTSSIKISIV
jgi:hypothetical protein